jgi:hypothetical protein
MIGGIEYYGNKVLKEYKDDSRMLLMLSDALCRSVINSGGWVSGFLAFVTTKSLIPSPRS